MQRVSTLGDWLLARRGQLHLSQTAVAEAAEMDRAYLSQIESGRVQLPNADLRRRLAAALGVPHVELLIAAGEITRDECEGVVEQSADDPVVRLAPLMHSVQWDETMFAAVRGMLREIAKAQRENAERDETVRLSGQPSAKP